MPTVDKYSRIRSHLAGAGIFADPRNDQLARHRSAVRNPHQGLESSIVSLINGLVSYAENHERRFESPIGDDAVIGAAWLLGCRGLNAMLNGELGRLDAGVIHQCLRSLMTAAGLDADEVSP